MSDQQYTEDYWAGTQALHQGRLSNAIEAFEKVPPSSPCWTMAQGNVGLSLLRMGLAEQAEARLLVTLREIDLRGCLYPPAHVQFRRNLAEAIGQQDRYTEALGGFREAIALADRLSSERSSLLSKIALEKAHTLNSAAVTCLQRSDFPPAISFLRLAREIYRQHSGDDRTGQAEVLTNLAIALSRVGDNTSADLALEEAIDILQETEDYDQLFRTLVAALTIESNLIQPDRAIELIEAGADEAAATNRAGIAYLRYGIGLTFLLRMGEELEAGQRMVQKARAIENRLEPLDPQVPKLRYFEALLIRLAGGSVSRITQVLLEGAHEWYRRIAVPLVPADFQSKVSDLHMHFRLLADRLREDDRLEEALVAFEAGRALGYATDVDPQFFSRVIAKNPFARDATNVDVSLLHNAQTLIRTNEVVVVLAVIPPRLVGFLIGGDRVDCVHRVIANAQSDLDGLDREVKLLPIRLSQDVGLRAVPPILLDFAEDLKGAIGDRIVSSFIPYDSLHMVPWRSVLHHRGVPWSQLRFGIGFNLLMWQGETYRDPLVGHDVIALGHGMAGSLDLRDEAVQFAAAFGSHGTVLDCAADGVRQALESGSIILISCHGKAVNKAGGPALVLELRDGSVRSDEVFPSRVLSSLVILSACESGFYYMAWSDYPLGAAPVLIRLGAKAVIGARYPIRASYAGHFFPRLGAHLAAGQPVEAAFVQTLTEMESNGADSWRDLACLELLCAV